MTTALIFAGGVGSRMKSTDIPKQFLEVGGVPIIIRTIRHFSDHPMVDQIAVVCLESWIGELEKDIEKFNIRKVKQILPGGSTGFQSIRRGLNWTESVSGPEDIVLICDGVRPILTEALITECIKAAEEFGSSVPVTPSIDSVLYSEDGETAGRNIERKKIFITQAPQGYRLEVIMSAHRQAEKEGKEAISSADLLIEQGKPVHLFPGIRENIKVTTREDLENIRASEYYGHFKTFAQEELGYGK